MPPSGRKGKTRVRRAPAATETHEVSDVETPEAIATPSRTSRKRGRPSETTAVPAPVPRNTRRKTKDTRVAEREDTEGTEPQVESDNETEPALPTEQDIIAHLRVAERHVNATEDYANDLLEGQENVPGYGKIAGRDWAFIIRKVEVNIGRPETQEKVENGADGGNGGHAGPSAKTEIDIDLGPDRQVSRSHAVISYDPDSTQWLIIVNGRNGLRVDNNLMRRGAKAFLRNGSVIEIAGTQMAFITTATEDGDGPIWDASIIKQAQKSSEEEEDGDEDPRSNGNRSHAHPAPRGGLQDRNGYPPQYDGAQQQQQQQQRTHPHSHRASMNGIPGTPMRSFQQFPKSSPAANYSRGVMMESTESIDYSADNAKDLKPPHSYAQLIGMAVLSTPEQQMTLNNIYKWIMANYAFYRFNTGGWQNSIRHNLSLNKAFTKIARRTDEPGKGMKWMIEPTEFESFVSQGMKGCRRPPLPGTQSTVFDSPSSPVNTRHSGAVAKREYETTPPMQPYTQSYPSAMEAYTPDRGSRRPRPEGRAGLGITEDAAQEYDFPIRTTPRHQNGLTAAANAAGSPPALFVNSDNDRSIGGNGVTDTPFPLRPTQRFAPPSTLKRPSDFIQFSSPAPFWKMDGLVGSTPFKPYDLSPLKTPFSQHLRKSGELGDVDNRRSSGTDAGSDDRRPLTGDDDERKDLRGDRKSPIVPSSSPPRPLSSSRTALENSPTLSRPATAVAKTLSQLAASTQGDVKELQQQQHQQPPTPTSKSSQPARNVDPPRQPSAQMVDSSRALNGCGPPPSQNGHSGFLNGHGQLGAYDDGEDEGIDLAKGFQPIGAYHQRNHVAISMGIGPLGVAGGQAFAR